MNILMRKFRETSLSNKMFFSSLAVILLLSFVIALFTRWVLISSLTSELEMRGRGIAQSIADSSRGYLLTGNAPQLTSLIFEARLGHRKALIDYVFIVDKDNIVQAHTFMEEFPRQLRRLGASDKTQLLKIGGREAYDIAAPVREGIYQIGTVHVGLKKEHIEKLINKLRTTFVGFLSAITVFFFVVSHLLSRYITRPISRLMDISNQICRGNLNLDFGLGDGDRPGAPVDQEHRECSVESGFPGDEVMQLTHSFHNMTVQLRHSQKEIRQSEDKYRSLFTSGPNPIFLLDRKTLEILDANPSAEETYGYSRGELIGRYFTDFGRFEYENKDLSKIARTGWPDGFILSDNIRYYRKNHARPLYIRIRACPAVIGNRQALILAATDITEMVEKDAQLIQASKMSTLGEMSAGVAHELNQPLNAIKLGNEYLKTMVDTDQPIPAPDLKSVALEVSNQVTRASKIINRLREFGRKTDFAREKVDINTPVHRVLSMLSQQLQLENIGIELDLDDALPPIMAHTNRLEQVLFNLITNGRDAINRKKESAAPDGERAIRIKTFQKGDQVALSVSDTGTGIPPEITDKIFEPFYTTKAVGKGLGLGLSIIYGIVRDYGGEIEFQSTEGTGTTFTQTYPAAE